MIAPKNSARTVIALAASAALFAASAAHAQSLVDIYEAARGFDANFQSAKLQYDANLAKADQAKAGILPTAGLSAGIEPG